jgi:hypothetical protein
MRIALLAVALSLVAAPALAQSAAPPPVCAGELDPFNARAPAVANAALDVGKAVDASLADATKLHFALTPEQSPAPGSFGGVHTLQIASAGTYRIALSAKAWIDVVRDGKAVVSTDHGERPCAGVTKAVEFPLTPGRYTVQLSGAASPTLGVLVARKP